MLRFCISTFLYFTRQMGENSIYYLHDEHGDVTKLFGETTDPTNGRTSFAMIKDYRYDAFGNEEVDYGQAFEGNQFEAKWEAQVNMVDNPFRYCGEYQDQETGNIYLRARYYDPSIERFISEDSYRGSVDEPFEMNLYSYCAENPVKFHDPSGHEKASLGEQWNAFWSAGILDSLKIKDIATESLKSAQEYAKELGLKNVTDNIADAFRHFSWNYKSVKAGIGKSTVEQVLTNHEVVVQKEVYKDQKSTYYRIPTASLMDLYNNKMGREQATDKTNKNKTAREVFDAVKNNLIKSLDEVPKFYNFDPSRVKNDGESYVIIKNGLVADPSKIEVVNLDEVIENYNIHVRIKQIEYQQEYNKYKGYDDYGY